MTDELVEIAARALVPVASGTQEDMYGRDLPDKQFDDLTPDWQEAFRRYARTVLAAVTPAIEARVTGEIVAWLRERAVDCRQAASDIQTDDDLNRRDGVGEALVAWVSRSQAYDYVADVLERGDHKESQP